jgi:hypothetical protein
MGADVGGEREKIHALNLGHLAADPDDDAGQAPAMPIALRSQK